MCISGGYMRCPQFRQRTYFWLVDLDNADERSIFTQLHSGTHHNYSGLSGVLDCYHRALVVVCHKSIIISTTSQCERVAATANVMLRDPGRCMLCRQFANGWEHYFNSPPMGGSMRRRGFTHNNGIQAPNIVGREYPCTFINQPMGGSGDRPWCDCTI